MSNLPELVVGETFAIVEPYDGKLKRRWRCHLEADMWWEIAGAEPDRFVTWPGNAPSSWHYTWTHRGAWRALDREVRRRQRVQRNEQRRIEVGV